MKRIAAPDRTSGPFRTTLLAALSLAAFVTAAPPLTAQARDGDALVWPEAQTLPALPTPASSSPAGSWVGSSSSWVGSSASSASSAASSAAGPVASPVPSVGHPDREFVVTTLLTSIGSMAGLYGGAWAGVVSTDEYGSGWYSEQTGAWIGAGIGTNLVAITTAGLRNGNWGRSAFGSLAGTALGAFLGMAVESSHRSGWMGLATYGLTHGIVTTAVGGS